MPAGVVKVFKPEGYGFIKRDDGAKDIYVHASAVKKSGIQGDLQEGDRLEFEEEMGDRGLRAVNLRLL